MIGIALLTLVPGELGGSETYVRELLRALARGGELDYRVLLPPVAPDGAGGLPSEVATEYLEARTIPKRLAAMTLATARPGPLRARLAAADVVHYPLTLRIPTRAQADRSSRCSTSSTSTCRRSSRAASARSARSRGTGRCAAPTA